jgi:hypothetical protein
VRWCQRSHGGMRWCQAKSWWHEVVSGRVVVARGGVVRPARRGSGATIDFFVFPTTTFKTHVP